MSWRRGTLVVAAALAGFGVVRAAAMWPYAPPIYTQGQVLTASGLGADFQDLGDHVNDLRTRLDAVAGAVGTLLPGDPDCPRGYTATKAGTITTCNRGDDVMVKVGSGRSAFWIDKHEASIWQSSDGSGDQYGAVDPLGLVVRDYPAALPHNGQMDLARPVYALSKPGVQPSTVLTWFQAEAACRASGKRLPTRSEWLAAAKGTPDPGDQGGALETCETADRQPRSTGQGEACASDWGAEDMIGNAAEYTDEWYMGVGGAERASFSDRSFNGDAIINGGASLGTMVNDQPKGWEPGLPAAALRGGATGDHAGAGIFALNLEDSPAEIGSVVGFRCVIGRR